MRNRFMAIVVAATLGAAGSAVAQDSVFRSAQVSSEISGWPKALAVADFDGDGADDVVTASINPSELTVYFQDNGEFLWNGSMSLPFVPATLAAGNFDGDDCVDIVVADANAAQVAFFGGDCNLNFEERGAPVAVAEDPYAMAVGKIDNDADLDLAIVSGGPLAVTQGRVSVLKGDGQGGFSLQATLAAGVGTSAVVIGDVNRDGRADFVALNSGARTLSVFLANAQGAFVAQTPIPLGGSQSELRALAMGLIDSDNIPDVVVADWSMGTVLVRLGNGSGGFTAGSSAQVGSRPQSVALADIDGDGKNDVVVANEQSMDVTLLFGNGTGQLVGGRTYVVGGEPAVAAVAGLDDQRAAFVVTANRDESGGSLAVLANPGNGTLPGVENVFAGRGPSGISGADVDSDGLPDLVVTHDDGAVLVFRSIAPARGGGFQPPRLVASSGSARSPRSVDFNRDDRADIAFVDGDASQVVVLLGTGRGTFKVGSSMATPAGPVALAIGDFNSDGRWDLVASSADNFGEVTSFLGRGDGTFVPVRSTRVVDGAGNMAVGELNCDGKPDLVVVSQATNNAAVLFGQGDGKFDTGPLLRGQKPTSAVIGFFDNNNNPDIVLGNGDVSGGVNNIFLGNCDGSFVANSRTPGGSTEGLAARDLNGDLLMDLVTFRAGQDNAVGVLRSDGQGRFFPLGAAVKTSRMPVEVVAADFNGDGRYDAATANNQALANNVSVLTNCIGQPGCSAAVGPAAVYGEANGDGRISAADLVAIGIEAMDNDGAYVENVSRPNPPLGNFPATKGVDANGDGHVDGSDRRAAARRIFAGG